MTQIEMQGILNHDKTSVEEEIKNALHAFFGDSEIPIKRVIVSDRFNDAVKSLVSVCSAEKFDYEQVHEYGVAMAKIIEEIEDNKIFFDLIMDARLFQRIDAIGRLDRLGIFIHEFTHMFDDKLRYESTRVRRLSSPRKSKADIFLSFGWRIWREYHAERNVYDAYEVVRKEGVQFDYAPRLGFFDTLQTHLESLETYLKENIWRFRVRKITLAEIDRLIVGRIDSLLILYAYTLALSDVVSIYKNRVENLENLNGYKFLRDDVPRIHTGLLELHEENRYRPELISELGESIEHILRRCGYEIRDHPNGYYIEIHDIEK